MVDAEKYISRISLTFENTNIFGEPTDIIGLNEVGRAIAEHMASLVGPKEVCFFDESIKPDPEFHYLDFEKMFSKTKIMIFAKDLPEHYFANITQLNKDATIFIPKEFGSTIQLLSARIPDIKLIVF